MHGDMLEALKFYLSVVNFETGIDPSLFLIFDDFWRFLETFILGLNDWIFIFCID